MQNSITYYQNQIQAYQKLLSTHPNQAEVAHTLAGLCNALGMLLQDSDSASAQAYFERAIQVAPTSLESYLNLALLKQKLGQSNEAIHYYQQVVKLAPEHIDTYCTLGNLWRHKQQYSQAVQAYQQALSIDPNSVMACFSLAELYLLLNQPAKALPLYEQWIHLPTATFLEQMTQAFQEQFIPPLPEHSPPWLLQLMAIAGKALALQANGQSEEAYQSLEPLIDHPFKSVQIALSLVELPIELNQRLQYLQSLLANNLTATDRQHILFKLGHLYEKNKDYSQAFNTFLSANRIGKQPQSIEAFVQLKNQIIERFTSAHLAQSPQANHGSDKPIFIVGMPRSGTTLVEQIIASHSAVYGAGELFKIQELFRCVESFQTLSQHQLNALAEHYLTGFPPSQHMSDKYPFNFIYLGWIERLFPQAKIIHIQRHPLDTCLSCFQQNFTQLPFTKDLSLITQYYGHYLELMQHWKEHLSLPIFHLQYEELVREPEQQIQALISFLKLPWEAQCLTFFKHPRPIQTASLWQVRQPMYTHSIGRYHNYRPFISDAIDCLKPYQNLLEFPYIIE